MTVRDTAWPEGTPCWVDLSVDDFARAQTFYGTLFGWDIPAGQPEFGGYSSATKDGHMIAGIMPKMDPSVPTAWTVYLATDDIAATVAKVQSNGGKLIADVMAVADLGKMAVAIDPGEAVVGFWESGKHTGFTLANEPGSVTWNENFTHDWTANKAFYTAVLGLEYDDMSSEGFQYATFRTRGSEGPAGGIGQIGAPMPANTPPHWNVYFKVGDAATAVDTVRTLGGTVVQPLSETPYGRMATVTDDQGAMFLLMSDIS